MISKFNINGKSFDLDSSDIYSNNISIEKITDTGNSVKILNDNNVEVVNIDDNGVDITGKLTLNGEYVSTVSNGIDTPSDINIYIYPKLYLLPNEDYTVYKSSIFFDKYKNFYNNEHDLVVVTDSKVHYGNDAVNFSSSEINGYASDYGLKNKIGIYIDNSLSQNTIKTYGVRCDATISDDINGKSIKYCAIGDSITDNGASKAEGYQLLKNGMTLNGVGLMTTGSYKDEGRSGWRLENIVGRVNAMGWGAIEIITPKGSEKNTSDYLHYNPFLRLATDDDKTNYPTRCYTFTASSQTSANYYESSYQDVLDASGNTSQDFYIYDISNYFKVQQDWDGTGTPCDAISFAFSTNEFYIEGYNQSTINRLLDNLQWLLDRTISQLPNVKIALIACPAWSNLFSSRYSNTILPWFKQMCDFVDNYNSQNNTSVYILQPHIFMGRCGYSYNRMSSNTVNGVSINNSLAREYTSIDSIHFDSIGYQEYAKAITGWLGCIATNKI